MENLINLNDFISKAISEVVKGVSNSKRELEKKSISIVDPRMKPEDMDKITLTNILLTDRKIVSFIEFDIVITVQKKTSGGFLLKIAKAEMSKKEQELHRIKFRVPVSYTHDRANIKVAKKKSSKSTKNLSKNKK